MPSEDYMKKQFSPLDLFENTSGEYWDGKNRYIIENGKVVRTENIDELRSIYAEFKADPLVHQP